jgi:hypothetical protein
MVCFEVEGIGKELLWGEGHRYLGHVALSIGLFRLNRKPVLRCLSKKLLLDLD